MDKALVVYMAVLFTSSCYGNRTSQMNRQYDECLMRYEYSKELHVFLDYKSCNDVYNRTPVCKQSIDVLYQEYPPYIYKDPATKDVVGLLPGILNQTLQACCFGCTKVRYMKPYTHSKLISDMLILATIYMPFVSYSGAKTVVGQTFIELFHTKGVVYVTSKEMNLERFSTFLLSIQSNWPLFLISIFLAMDAGIIVWLLDCWYNEEEFPRQFRKGLLEGFWWAYVTMTTVGYGDKTPRSLPARVLGIIWITVGISISGIFTASLITGMTKSLDEGALNLNGKKVGVMNKTRYELNIAMKNGADTQVYLTYEEMKAAFKSKHIEGMLFDLLAYKHYLDDLRKEIKDLHTRANAIENTKTSYGMFFPFDEKNISNRKWSKYLAKFFHDNPDNMDVLLHDAAANLAQKLSAMDKSDNSGQLSIFNSPEIYKLLFKYFGFTTLALLFLGFAFEKIRLWIKLYIASRQDKWTTKVESTTIENGREQEESSTDDVTTKIRERFQAVMQEIEIEEGYQNYAGITEKVLERCFFYRIKRANIEVDFQTKQPHHLEAH